MRLARLVELTAMIAAALLTSAALPGNEEPQDNDTMVGEFLVAAPDMGDPRFGDTVILIVRHDGNGTFGLVINRPVEERPLANLLSDLGVKDAHVAGNVRIYDGGPVEPDIGFVVHSAEYRNQATLAVDDHLAVTSSAEILRDIGHGAGPKKTLIAFGYAGWGPGQLEAEMAHHDWFTEPEDPTLVFDTDPSIVWKTAFARRDRSL